MCLSNDIPEAPPPPAPEPPAPIFYAGSENDPDAISPETASKKGKSSLTTKVDSGLAIPTGE